MNNKEAIKSMQNIIEYWTYKPTEIEAAKLAIEAIKFKEYFMDLYGKDLQVANWHLNGEFAPLDYFIESALEHSEM